MLQMSIERTLNIVMGKSQYGYIVHREHRRRRDECETQDTSHGHVINDIG